jgi:hypothetical protein
MKYNDILYYLTIQERNATMKTYVCSLDKDGNEWIREAYLNFLLVPGIIFDLSPVSNIEIKKVRIWKETEDTGFVRAISYSSEPPEEEDLHKFPSCDCFKSDARWERGPQQMFEVA